MDQIDTFIIKYISEYYKIQMQGNRMKKKKKYVIIDQRELVKDENIL